MTRTLVSSTCVLVVVFIAIVAGAPKPKQPTASLSVAPAAILTGGSATLSWSTSNATTVVMNQGIGTVAASGTLSVAPAATTTYVLTASNSAGSTVAQATLTVSSGSGSRASGLTHIGSFNLPDGDFGSPAGSGFHYGGTALGFNAQRGSLFIVGHDWYQLMAEVAVPALGGVATVLQPFFDASDGKAALVGSGAVKVGGTLARDGQLFFTEYLYYDASASQVKSHFSRPLPVSPRARVAGPTQVGPLGAGFYSGYMADVPLTWQGLLGGTALTGNAALNIISRTSYGPAAFAFNPNNMSATGAQPLVYYDTNHTTLGPWSGSNSYYGGADTVRGVVFPVATSSVLFFGRHGTTFCYGTGGATGGDCFDPADSSKGVHGYPYTAYVWAYDAYDLAAVHAGQKNPWDVVPYAVWSLPEMGFNVGGAAYDPATASIFVSELNGQGTLPVVHVYQVQ